MLKKRIVTFLLSLLFAIVLTTGALASFNVFAEESYTGYFIGSSVPNGKDIKDEISLLMQREGKEEIK